MKKTIIRTSAFVGLLAIGLASCAQVESSSSTSAAATTTDAAKPVPAKPTVPVEELETEDYMTGLKITAYNGTDTDLNLPATKDGKDILFIDNNAFENKDLVAVTIPSTVTAIGVSAFASNALTDLTLNDGLLTIGASAFTDNALTDITLPSSVTTVGASAFANNAIETFSLPSTMTTIADSMFADNALTTLTLDDAVTSIGANAFENNALTGFTFPTSLTSIGASAFAGNSYIWNITEATPSNAVTFGAGAFSSASLYVPNGAVADYEAESNWNDAFLVISTVAPESAFDLTNVTGGVEIKLYTGSELDIAIPATINGKDVVSIAREAFYDMGLTGIVLPEGVTSIGEYAFAGPNNVFTDIIIPDSVTTIEASAFSAITTIETVVLGSGLQTIKSSNFTNSNVTSVTSKRSTPPSLASSSFGANAKTLYVPIGSKAAYEVAPGWSNRFVTFGTIVETDI